MTNREKFKQVFGYDLKEDELPCLATLTDMPFGCDSRCAECPQVTYWDEEYKENDEWIPVTERLPKNNEEVWITDMGGKVERARFYKEPHPEDGEKDRFACGTYLVYAENVLAWQSILKPEPYKEGE